MKESEIKKLVRQSEITSQPDFTNNVLSRIQAQIKPSLGELFWPKKKVLALFALMLVLSGFLLHMVDGFSLLSNHTAIPFLWALLLLVGLNYVLTLDSCKSILQKQV